MAQSLDLVVIGAGPGGYVAAIRAAQLGKRVACVDRRASLGGTCLNVGCIPSKALLDSSELFNYTKNRLGVHGIRVESVGLDLKTMMTRKDGIIKGLTDGVAFLFKKNRIQFFQATARLEGRGRVTLKATGQPDQSLETSAVLLATGSEAMPLPSLPFDGSTIVTSTEALEFDKVPSHLIVVGGGYIGVEIGSVWSRLGAKVTVVEFLPKILGTSDGELAGRLHRILTRQGLEIHVSTKVVSATSGAGKVVVQAQAGGKDVAFAADKVLVAIGRRPLTTGLGLESLGLATQAGSGRILVDENYQTNVSGIYAIGDLVPGPMLAHKAQEEGYVFAERLAGRKPHVNYQAIPSVVYTWPELASVGLTEEQVKENGNTYKIGKSLFSANARARSLDETEGLVKVIADATTDRILGAHILGPRASDMIAEMVALLEFSASAEDLGRICHAHPTLSEAALEAGRAVSKSALSS
jgi:dihydrolipoamide dehydrogenase